MPNIEKKARAAIPERFQVWLARVDYKHAVPGWSPKTDGGKGPSRLPNNNPHLTCVEILDVRQDKQTLAVSFEFRDLEIEESWRRIDSREMALFEPVKFIHA